MRGITSSAGLGGTILICAIALRVSTADIAADPQLKPDPGQQITCGNQPCDAVARGFRAFHDRTLVGMGGNGRSCADCHMPSDSFQLSPAGVEARFQKLQERLAEDPAADDPLFRPIDADDFRVNGQAASDYSNLRQNGLVRITLPLPPNIRLVDQVTGHVSEDTFVDVWRMVPSVNDVKITGDDGVNPWLRGPNPTGGYQLDARMATLQEQALGALSNHADATTASRAQGPRAVDPLGRWNFAACPPRLARNTRLYEVTQANGVVARFPSSDPGRALLTGFVLGRTPFDDWNKFDVPGVRGISRTAPYFHNNSAATLEELVDHYIELFKFIKANAPPGPPPPVASTDGVNFDRQPQPHERAALLAYLRKL